MFVLLVLMLMLMSWVFSLAYASVCAYAYACACALVKTILKRSTDPECMFVVREINRRWSSSKPRSGRGNPGSNPEPGI